MESALKRKVTVKLINTNGTASSRPMSRDGRAQATSRPASPFKYVAEPEQYFDSTNLFKPKAKVNSSANISRKATSTSRSIARSASVSLRREDNFIRVDTASISRPSSPFKQQLSVRSGASSPIPTNARVTRSTLKPQATKSTPNTPVHRRRSLTSKKSLEPLPSTARKPPNGLASLHHVDSMASLRIARAVSVDTSPPQTVESPELVYHETLNSPQGENGYTRVKAKVSEIQRTNDSGSLSPPIPFSTIRNTVERTRAPSISSSLSMGSSPSSSPALDRAFYPITTATPAANPYRFVTTRPSPPASNRYHYQPFAPNSQVPNKTQTSVPQVNPADIPLPTQSPPASTVSFSSRSSASYSSKHLENAQHPLDSKFSSTDGDSNSSHVLSDDDITARFNGTHEPNGIGLGISGATQKARRLEDEYIKLKAAAKSNRKIADLEITNRSLLAINTSLETIKHRQAKEIRELKRKLRESRLILPPPAYRAVKSSLDRDDTEEEDYSGGEDGDEEEKATTGDETYRRIKSMLERLVETGTKAVEAKIPTSSEGGRGAAKVLSADEVRNWRVYSADASTPLQGLLDVDSDVEDGHVRSHNSPSPALILPDEELHSEDGVEAIASSSDPSATRCSPPPILVVSGEDSG